MTVKQLIRKLDKLPKNAVVTIPNYSLYVDGDYKATNVEPWGNDEVRIVTDYKERMSALE